MADADPARNTPLYPSLLTLSSLILLLLSYCVYILRLHRRYPYPGPFFAKFTSLWLYTHSYLGTEASAIRAQHLKHNSPIIRIAPTQLSISNQQNDPEEANPVKQIYIHNGGLPKPAFYTNFDIDGHATLFSTQDHKYRARRAKTITAMFALSRVRESFENADGACCTLVDKFVERFRRRRHNAAHKNHGQRGKLDLADECRRLATDVVTAHLYGRAYGALDEDGLLSNHGKAESEPSRTVSASQSSTASPFVDSFVVVGRLFLLPPLLVSALSTFIERVLPDRKVAQSTASIDAYNTECVANAKEEDDTYQSRLLFNAGISSAETNAQVKDLIFAGTDSTGITLTTICFHLIRRPDWLARLRDELLRTTSSNEQNAFLDATVKEGLRLGMANPTRMPRQVPYSAQQVEVLGHNMPPGAIIGCSSYCLHFDPKIFVDPFSFQPERWLEAKTTDSHALLNRMDASMMPFGAGSRQCIARNLAMQELLHATTALVRSGVLEGMETVHTSIPKYEWFNSQVVGKRVEVFLPTKG